MKSNQREAYRNKIKQNSSSKKELNKKNSDSIQDEDDEEFLNQNNDKKKIVRSSQKKKLNQVKKKIQSEESSSSSDIDPSKDFSSDREQESKINQFQETQQNQEDSQNNLRKSASNNDELRNSKINPIGQKKQSLQNVVSTSVAEKQILRSEKRPSQSVDFSKQVQQQVQQQQPPQPKQSKINEALQAEKELAAYNNLEGRMLDEIENQRQKEEEYFLNLIASKRLQTDRKIATAPFKMTRLSEQNAQMQNTGTSRQDRNDIQKSQGGSFDQKRSFKQNDFFNSKGFALSSSFGLSGNNNIQQLQKFIENFEIKQQYTPQRFGNYQMFVEGNFMKEANIYGQFDKKGNLYENRLFVRNNINQIKLQRDQNNYEKKMKTNPEEEARINNQSIQNQTNMLSDSTFRFGNPEGKEQVTSGRTKTLLNKVSNQNIASVSLQSQSKFNGAQATAQSADIKALSGKSNKNIMRASSYRKEDQEDNLHRYTFSRANGPKINWSKTASVSHPNKPHCERPKPLALYEKLIEENKDVNRSSELSFQSKSLNNQRIENVQRSLLKLKDVDAAAKYWSLMDQDNSVVAKAIGSDQHIFRVAQETSTQDPRIFKDKPTIYTKEHELNRGKDLSIIRNQNFLYVNGLDQKDENNNLKIKTADLTQAKSFYEVAKEINVDVRMFYSQQLDKKGGSNLHLKNYEGSPTMNQTQNKFRSNTQSRQVDGLYKETEFGKKTQMLNHTRQNFNILRPFEAQSASPIQILEKIRKGHCHQMYGISEFQQKNRLAAEKPHEQYWKVYESSNNCFKKKNGEFTQFVDNWK